MRQQISKDSKQKLNYFFHTSLSIMAVFSFVLFLLPQSAHALTVSPSRIEITGNPGESVTAQFDLINEQEDDRIFYTSAENFEAQGETGTPSFVVGNEGLASWISVEPQISLKKGEEKKASFTVNIPKNAEPGGYFAAVFLNTAPPATSTGQVSVGARIGVLVLLRVAGDIKEGGGLVDFTTQNGVRFVSHLPISFSYRFTNSGGDRVEPKGSILIKNTIGLTTEDVSANPALGNILPGSTRKFWVTWGDPSTEAPTGFWDSARYELSHFAFGVYTAHLNLVYGAHDSSAKDSFTFLVLPWQLLSIIVVVIGGFWFIIRKYNQWIVKKAIAAK